jgi:hypothetical protein
MANKCMVCGKGCRTDQNGHESCLAKVYRGEARYLTIEEQKAGVVVEWER